jgi:hypothetical protein
MTAPAQQHIPGQPYLKAGPHGYEWANSRWHFANDPDLFIGIGHQIVPGDREKLTLVEFYAKYPKASDTTFDWPCGCTKPDGVVEEGVSEEE